MYILVGILAMMAMATTEDDKECADEFTNLAACIPYVSGTAKKPNSECCEDTQKVKSANPKCLCVLIKESTDPSLGLPINTSLALQMPSACNIDAEVCDCPCNHLFSMFTIFIFELPYHILYHIHSKYHFATYVAAILKLPPDSPDAKIFKIGGADSSTSTATAAGSTSPSSTSFGSDPSSKPTGDSSDGTKLCSSVLVAMGVALLHSSLKF